MLLTGLEAGSGMVSRKQRTSHKKIAKSAIFRVNLITALISSFIVLFE